MVFCNSINNRHIETVIKVTILILIDGFLQYKETKLSRKPSFSHNPYFNRWFSAIKVAKKWLDTDVLVTILILIDGFLQYKDLDISIADSISHNPYFNRWFSAIS